MKSISLLAATAIAASVFKREDEGTSSPKAGRASIRGVLDGVSDSSDLGLSGADWTLYTDQCLELAERVTSGGKRRYELRNIWCVRLEWECQQVSGVDVLRS